MVRIQQKSKNILFISKSDCKKKQFNDKNNKITHRQFAKGDHPPWELYFLNFDLTE